MKDKGNDPIYGTTMAFVLKEWRIKHEKSVTISDLRAEI
jgi:hypothetical protein